MPLKYQELMYTQPCYYANSADNEFIFDKIDKTIFAFGLGGRGYKFLPYHGKRVYEIIAGNIDEGDKYKLKNK
jgi:glycine/D-amino acid oxidase-like deaminating enzyme